MTAIIADTEDLSAYEGELDDRVGCEWGGGRSGIQTNPACQETAQWKVWWRRPCYGNVVADGEPMNLFCAAHATRLRRCTDGWRCSACGKPLRGNVWHAVERFEEFNQ